MYQSTEIHADLTVDNKGSAITSDRMSRLLTPWLFQMSSDIIAVTLAYLLQFYIRYHTGLFETVVRPDLELLIRSGLALMMYWIICFWFFGLYKNWYVRSPFDEFFTIVRAAFVGNFIVFFFVFLDSPDTPRLLFLVNFALVSLMAGFGRIIAKRIQVVLRVKRLVTIPAIIIGDPVKALELGEKISKSISWGYRSLGYVITEEADDNSGQPPPPQAMNGLFLGRIGCLSEIIDRHSPREVLITFNQPNHGLLMNILSVCAEKNVRVKIVPDLYDIFTGLVRTLPIYGIPLIEVNKQLLKPWEAVLKRIIDVTFSLAVIAAGLPFWLLIAVVVKTGSRGPIFYKQQRVGKDERKFMMYKFRSMVQDAERGGPRWASVNDNRVTPFGKFLRKSHLDEIPQFWNVLKGEMSLVGPRPERPFFVEKFSSAVPYYKRRLIVRPGITGWWQVNYTTYEESNDEIENRLKNDFYYIENMSLKLDVEIIIRTVVCVIKGHGQA